MPRRVVFLLLVGLAAMAAGVSAHDLSQSTATLAIDANTARVRLAIDLLAFEGVDRNLDSRVTYEELDPAIDRVFAAIKAHYLVTDPDAPASVVAERYEIADDHVLHIDVRYTFDRPIRRLDVTSKLDLLARPDHQHFITAEIGGRQLREQLSAAHPSASFYVGGFSRGRLAGVAGAFLLLVVLVVLRLRPRVGAALIALLAMTACGQSSGRPADIPSTGSFTFAAAGDTLLTQPLDQGEPGLAAVASLVRQPALAFLNLDVNLLGSGERQLADVRARPQSPFGDERIARLLRDLGVDMVSLANDHATDYGPEGLRSTAAILDAAGLLHAGTGKDLADARSPVYVGSNRRVALIAVSASSLPESRATPAKTDIAGRPGLNPLRYSANITVDPPTFAALSSSVVALNAGPPPGDRELTMFGTVIRKGDHTSVQFLVDLDDERAVIDEIRKARASAEVVIVSLHAHEPSNASEVPADFVQRFARSAIDAGAALVVGHGPHRLRGIERYKEGAILYSLGNFIYQGKGIDYRAANMFDRGADLYGAAIGAGGAPASETPRDLNGDTWWEGAMALATFSDGKLSALRVEPIDLGLDRPLEERGTPTLAAVERRAAILSRIAALSKEFGTSVETATGQVRLR